MEQKHSGVAAASTGRPKAITERPLDVLYLAYFAIHLIASVAIDAQLTYPPYSQRLFPEPVRKVLQDYLKQSKDPFLLAAEASSSNHVWFRVLLASETFFQIPCFIVFIRGLLNDNKRTYPLMIAYGVLAASSTLQCICSVLFGSDGNGLTGLEVRGLLQNYIPFCLIPTFLTIDMISRVLALLPAHPTGDNKNKTE